MSAKQSKGISAIAYLVLVVALVLAACTAFAQDPPAPEGAPAPSASTEAPDAAPPGAADAGPDEGGPGPSTSPAATSTASQERAQAWVTGGDLSSGLSPLPNNGPMPLKWLPPGAFEQD